MDMFVCDDCNHVDAVTLAYPSGPSPEEGQPRTHWQCSKCQTGKWHQFFEYEPYRAGFDVVINRPTGIGLG